MSDDYTVIRLDRVGHVAEVVLDNPAKLNAMAPIFFEEIKRVFEEIDEDPEIRCAILWAEGRHFTAGLDLFASTSLLSPPSEEAPATKNYEFYKHVLHLQDCISAAEKCRKPVIAAVHGHCIGGGVDLTTACDFRLCTKEATFSIHETKIAIVADVGTLQRITNVVSKGIAREMAFTGCKLPSDRALSSGLVNDVFDDKDAMLARARELAAEIASFSPLAVQGTKEVLNYSDDHNLRDGLEFIALWNSGFLKSNDVKEAVTAFMEKREPTFTGS
ncbi:MAG: crotonase/enoyl-CoA hydratase family protein [Candidatus Hydrogenedentota bacterium]